MCDVADAYHELTSQQEPHLQILCVCGAMDKFFSDYQAGGEWRGGMSIPETSSSSSSSGSSSECMLSALLHTVICGGGVGIPRVACMHVIQPSAIRGHASCASTGATRPEWL